MRTTAVEHETDEKVPTHGAEAQRQDGALPVAERAGSVPVAGLANAPPALLHPRLLLGLQARAGNAAVAGLIARSHKPVQAPEQVQAREPSTPAAAVVETQPGITQTDGATPAASSADGAPVTTGEAGAVEETTAAPRAGESDEELAELDAAAAAPAVGGRQDAEHERGLVAEDAQAELAAETSQSGGEAETSGGAAEPGSPIEARPPPTVTDVAGVEPSAGLARVGGLPPAQLLSSLGSVSGAVERQTADEHQRLAASPPQRPRHPGAPATAETPASTRITLADRAATSITKVAEGRDVEVVRPAAPPVVPDVPIPNGQLPTRDPGLELKPGALPHLPLEGTANPAVVQQQRGNVVGHLEREHAAAQRDAAKPMGEDEIFPSAPAEMLRAGVGPAPGAAGQPAAAPKPGEDGEAASIIAQQEKGGEIQSAVGTGLASVAGQRQEYAQRTAGERAKADAEMAQLEQANSQEQAGERAAAKREVLGIRGQWSEAQQQLVAGAQRETETKTSETLQTVAQERGAAEQQAAEHYQKGQEDADKARRAGEQQAAAERQKAQSQSPGGLLGAIGSAAQSLFDKAKQAVQSVFDRARQLVRSAVERAQQLATAVMERARQTIVGAIRAAGTVLVAIGDRVLGAFPALRDRFRKAIQDRIAAAEAVVNKLASALKQAVQSSLNLLGTALSAAIGLMRQGMQLAIDSVRGVVQGALAFAKGALAAFGTFAVLVKDIAANPGQWISNLAAGVRDGIRNYLWVEIKTAVKGWFSDKVQEVVGVGQAIWHLLQRGGISIAEIARMVWEGLKAAIPGILIALLIEKVMSLIVPAVGAILTIIQSIQAGWASLGRILQAFETFFAFLKQVKLGSAGPQFAKALAAGAIAAVEFVSNFLMTRLKGAASSVSNRLRAIARRIGERLSAIGGRIVRGAKAVGGAFRRAGQKVRAGFDRLRGKRPKSHADHEAAKRNREEAAFAATKAKLDGLFARGVSRARLAAEVGFLKLRYRWGTLRVQGAAEAQPVSVLGGFSPVRTVTVGKVAQEAETLEQMISRYPVAKRKLHQVQEDPFIPGSMKLAWMRAVETRLRGAHRQEQHPNPYDLMIEAAKANPRHFFVGPIVPVKEIIEVGGLVRHVRIRRLWDSLKPEIQADYITPNRWIHALKQNPSLLAVADFVPGTMVPGVWWSAHQDSGGIGEKAVKQLRLRREDYPSGAARFFLPQSEVALPNLRKPTAFDGMFFRKYVASPGSVWGIIPDEDASTAGIREGVSKNYIDVHRTAVTFVLTK